MNTIKELQSDPEFQKSFPLVANKLKGYLQWKQREISKNDKLSHEEVGRQVKVLSEFYEDLDAMYANEPPKRAPRAARLSNADFREE